MSRFLLPHTFRLTLALSAILAGGLLCSATQALAAEGGVQPAGEAPIIESESESNITEHGATLEAQINPDGFATEYELWLECGVAFQCGSAERVGSGRLPASDSGQAVSVDLSDLPSGNRYKYWVVASNSEGTTKGTVRIFTPTESWPGPVSETGAAANITERGATLAGQIHPKKKEPGEFEYFFEYGASTSYGASAPTSPEARIVRFGSCGMICEGEKTKPKPVSVDLTGLEPGTTYHYRLISTSAGGYRSFGDDATFITGGETILPSSSRHDEPGASPLVPGATPLVPPLVKTVKPKVLTKAQKLAKALKQCKREPKRKRAACEKQAKKQYATTARDTRKTANKQNRTRRR